MRDRNGMTLGPCVRKILNRLLELEGPWMWKLGLFIPALILLVACSGSPEMRTLKEAERVVEAYPDSARNLILKVDSANLSKKSLALYALLDAQTRHKLYMDPPASDSLLNLAVSHYQSTSQDTLLMKTLFYRAVYHEDRGDIKEAAKDAITSYELANELQNEYWKAKNAEVLSDLAMGMQNYEEELKWRKLAVENYRKSRMALNVLYSMCDLSGTYLNLRDTVNAITLDDSITDLLKAFPEEQHLHNYHAFYSIFLQNYFGNFDKADSLYSRLKNVSYFPDNDRYPLDLIKANVYLNRQQYKKCHQILDSLKKIKVEQDRKSMLYDQFFRLAKESEDLPLLKESADTLLKIQYRLLENALKQSVTSTQRDYFQVEASTKERARHRAVVIGIWIAAVSIILILGGIAIYRWRLKLKNRQIAEKIASIYEVSSQLKEQHDLNQVMLGELESLRSMRDEMRQMLVAAEEKQVSDETKIGNYKRELKEKSMQIGRLTRQLSNSGNMLSSLYSDRWETINMLCKEFFDKDSTDSSIILANINSELERLKSKEFYRTVEKDLNLYSDGIMNKLREQCIGLSDEEIRIAMLCFAGFSSIAISLITGSNPSTFYARRMRIAAKIRKINPPDAALFLSRLKK